MRSQNIANSRATSLDHSLDMRAQLCSTGVFPDSGVSAGFSNFWKSRVRVRRLKNYLKYFYLYFLYIFTIKIFLINTLLCLDSQNTSLRWEICPLKPISTVPAWFKADFGFFRPFWSPANTTWFWLNWHELKPSRHKSIKIKKLKKKTQTRHRRVGSSVASTLLCQAALDAGAAPILPRLCIIGAQRGKREREILHLTEQESLWFAWAQKLLFVVSVFHPH